MPTLGEKAHAVKYCKELGIREVPSDLHFMIILSGNLGLHFCNHLFCLNLQLHKGHIPSDPIDPRAYKNKQNSFCLFACLFFRHSENVTEQVKCINVMHTIVLGCKSF